MILLILDENMIVNQILTSIKKSCLPLLLSSDSDSSIL